MRNVGIVLLLLSLVLSCSTRVVQKEKDPIEEQEKESQDQWWDVATEVLENLQNAEFYSKSPEDQLRYAKHAASKGDYDLAIAVYSKLYKDESNDAAIRAEALFRSGKIYSNLLYLYKDYDKALYFFEKLIAEFPDSQFHTDAEQSIKNIHKIK